MDRAPAHPPDAADPGRGPVDVDALMTDLRRRVEEKKAQGLYTVDVIAAEAAEGQEPFGPDELERMRRLAVHHLDLSTTASTKPVVGGLITRIKRVLVRGTSQPALSLVSQSNEFHAALLAYLAELGAEVGVLRRELRRGGEDVQGTPDGSAAERVAALEAAVAELGAAAIPARLARLERPDAVAAAPAAPADPSSTPASGTASAATLRIEAARDATRGEGRWADYAAALGDEGPLIHLGAGSGRALPHLGARAEGVEADPELAAAAKRAGHPVRCADPVGFLASLAPGSVRGALVTDVLERLDGPGILLLAAALGRALAPGGRVVLEGVNPTSIQAVVDDGARPLGPWRLVHPDTVRAVVESAGLEWTATDPVDAGGGAGEAPDIRGARRYAVHARR